MSDGLVRCGSCFRACVLAPGQTGFCRARGESAGAVAPLAYGRVTSIAVDPIEKKPIALWRPGTTVLSLGGYGCNLRCPWCQNAQISQAGEGEVVWREMAPDEVAALAARMGAEDARMQGVAYTYNEPLAAWEFVRDCARAVRERGLANVLVSAGCMSREVIAKVAPLIDAANIDLKSFSEKTYRAIGGDLASVKDCIRALAAEPGCHLEVTTLIVPGVNDTDDEMRAISSWLASVDPAIVLHVTRFHPSWRMRDAAPTPVARVYALAELARAELAHVFTGNC